MALTKGAWTTSTVNKRFVATCTVTAQTSDNDIYTLKTPTGLDPTKPWVLVVNSAGATLDATVAAIPLDVYIGYSDTFALTGNDTTVAATGGSLFKAGVIDDVRTAAQTVLFDPNLAQSEVTAIATGGLKCKAPIAPYYIFNANCASAVSAGDCTFKIIQ